MRNLLCAGYNYFLLLSSLLPSSFFPFLLSFIILIHLQYNTSATSYSNAAQESLAMRRAVISLSSLLCPIPTPSPLSFSLSLLLSFSPSLLLSFSPSLLLSLYIHLFVKDWWMQRADTTQITQDCRHKRFSFLHLYSSPSSITTSFYPLLILELQYQLYINCSVCLAQGSSSIFSFILIFSHPNSSLHFIHYRRGTICRVEVIYL